MSAAQHPLQVWGRDEVGEHVALRHLLASGERMPLHVAEGLAALLDAVRNAVLCTEMGDAYADAERVPVWWREVMTAYRLEVPRQRTRATTEGEQR